MTAVRALGPATVANLCAGFDVLGLALDGPGDVVEARPLAGAGVRIGSITGDGGRLPRDAERNTAGVAAREVLRRAGADLGVELHVAKGLPLGSGLGSSAASAAAAAVAVNRLLGDPLDRTSLVAACVEAEAVVSGRHADNVAPALLGGLVLVPLPVPAEVVVVVATPAFELETRAARAVLPDRVPLSRLVAAAANLGALVAACAAGDLELLSRSLVDEVVGPARAPLIPGCEAVIDAAARAGALGAGISGAGPSMFALCRADRADPVATAMRSAFSAAGLASTARASPLRSAGAHVL